MKPILYITLSAVLGFIFGFNSNAVQPPQTVNVRAAETVVLYFNANWNAANHYIPIDRLTNCNIQKVMIDQAPHLQKKFNVTQVPSVILFKNGVEVKRWEAGISLKLAVHGAQIQGEINK